MLKRTALMMMLGLVLAGLTYAAPSPDPDDDGMMDAKKLQGTWSLVSAEEDGKPSDKPTKDVSLVIKDKTIKISDKGRTEAEATLTIDAKKKPREMTLTISTEKGEVLCIYVLEGDTLKMCFKKGGGGARPKEFSSKEGHSLLVFKKNKP